MRLADVIDRWIGRVEIVLAGADLDLRGGEEALAAGDALAARGAARRVLARAPESPLGLALLADACEAGGLDAELALTLEELAQRAPSRAEVLVRLGRSRAATLAAPEDVRDAFARALAVADGGSEARRDALIGLADLDLSLGEGARAELWLERAAGDHSPAVEVRRAEALLWRGDPASAKKLLDGVVTAPTDGRAGLARGRALAAVGDAAAFVPLVRAMVLDMPGASEALSGALAHLQSDAQIRTRLRSVVDAKGEQDLARWRAAFAQAEGARHTARSALADAVRSGDATAARPLLDAAIEDRDPKALRLALGALPEDPADDALVDGRRLDAALARSGVDALDALTLVAAHVAHRASATWADAIAGDAARALIPAGAMASWAELLGRLNIHAHAAGDLASAARIGELAAERSRPVRLAVVGEFNAGKSTFINALIGTDVAPTGVLPTTATIHRLRWAPDPFAKIVFVAGHDPTERIVALGELRAAVKSLDPGNVARVEIGMPLPALVRVEILDTPGFNAPDSRHAEVARAGLDEADIAFWLFDATQALKDSERIVLADARRTGLPIQLLVNKIDRLAPADVIRVMRSLEEGAAETEARSWGPILALSAKKALAGKLGDADALRASGWGPVETLLEERIIARSAELKEAALRRRAAVLVERLAQAWRGRAADEASETKSRADRAHEAGQAAALIESNADSLAGKLAQSLAPQKAAWARDVELLFVGRDRESADRDPGIARYRVDRALSSIAPPLARALASLAPHAAVSPADLAPAARAIVRAAALCAPADVDVTMGAIASASIATLVDELFARAAAAPPTPRAEGILRELRAFAAALA